VLERQKTAVQSQTVKIVLAFFALYVVWGSTYIAIHYGLQSFPVFMLAGARFLCAGTILFTWAMSRGASRPKLSHWLHSGLIGVMLLVIANAGVAFALKTVPTGLVSLLSAMVPIFFVLIDWLRPHGNAPSKRIILGLLIGSVGALFLIGPDKILQGKGVDFLGIIMIFVSSLSWAAGSIYSRQAKHKLPESPMLATSMQMLLAGVILSLLSLTTGEFTHFHAERVSAASLLALGYLITFGSLIAFSSYVWLLQVVSPARVSTYAYVNPVVAVLLGWILLGEAITTQTIFAAATILLSVWFINDSNHAKKVAKIESERKAQNRVPLPVKSVWGDKELCAEQVS
jgi:drug/metabolite transporter (DMT)-like permease